MNKIISILSILLLASCGSGEKKAEAKPESREAMLAKKYKLTEFQLNNGIGPITSKLKISAINGSKAEKGKAVFDMKCMACHKPDARFVGPSIRYVTDRRSPEYIMNMILNPDEMLNKHPLTRKMLAQYMNKMTFQNVTHEEALQILEYFRSLAKEGKLNKIPETEKFPSLDDLK